ncbi:unnamed protein product [Arctia plantaginis]|uniref:Uncharacterized protein n=1 Tax=Arctia plantaginis TaxID=874455 RepID=A0A8S1B4D4_ARCPL|nr:unnamed protein product [Arctia plantaginis]
MCNFFPSRAKCLSHTRQSTTEELALKLFNISTVDDRLSLKLFLQADNRLTLKPFLQPNDRLNLKLLLLADDRLTLKLLLLADNPFDPEAILSG